MKSIYFALLVDKKVWCIKMNSMYDINTDIYDAFRRQKNPFRAEKDYLECVILNRLFEEPYFYDNFIFTGGGTGKQNI